MREPMIPGQARHPVLGVEDQHPVFWQIHRRPDDSHLGGAVGQAGSRVGEVEFPWLHGDLGIGGLEVPDQPEQHVGAGSDQVAQPDAPVAPGRRDQIVDGGVHTPKRIVHLGQPRRAEVGQRDLAGTAGEQQDAELVLELLDGSGERGLGDEQLLRGAPVVQLLAEDGEVAQLAQGYVRSAARDALLGRDVTQACHATFDFAHNSSTRRSALARLSAASGRSSAIAGLTSAIVSSAVMNRGDSPVSKTPCGSQVSAWSHP
jgi:hypothetical protein